MEVNEGDCVRLAVVSSPVPDVQYCWELYNRCIKNAKRPHYILDDSDDTLVVLEGPSYDYHSHVSPLNLMKPLFQIPADLESEMKTWIKRADTENKNLHN